MCLLAVVMVRAQPVEDLENSENVQAVQQVQDDQESDLEGAESRYGYRGGWSRGYGGGWGGRGNYKYLRNSA